MPRRGRDPDRRREGRPERPRALRGRRAPHEQWQRGGREGRARCDQPPGRRTPARALRIVSRSSAAIASSRSWVGRGFPSSSLTRSRSFGIGAMAFATKSFAEASPGFPRQHQQARVEGAELEAGVHVVREAHEVALVVALVARGLELGERGVGVMIEHVHDERAVVAREDDGASRASRRSARARGSARGRQCRSSRRGRRPS